MSPKQLRQTIYTLHRLYPQQTTELVYNTPFQLLVAVMLSAQTTDRQVNKVTLSLFEQVTGPQDIVDMRQTGLDHAIRSIGLHHTKAKHIYLLSQILTSPGYNQQCATLHHTPQALAIYNLYHYRIPDTIEQLISLPGVGIKTAKVVGQILYNLPVIAVDTHVHRICNRIGIVHTSSPQETDKKLADTIPHDLVPLCHHSMVLFGRYTCKALTPLCPDCPLKNICGRYQKSYPSLKNR